MVSSTYTKAIGGGRALDTHIIQSEIDHLAKIGGGTLRFPAGRFLIGTIQIRSRVTLHLEVGATLLGSTNAGDYENVDPFIDGSGTPMGHALIVAMDAEHMAIEGSGTIDGQGPRLKESQQEYRVRPFLIRWVRCRHVAVRDVFLTGPAAWTLNFFQSSDALVEGITIRCRGTGLHNNDGVNIDSSQRITVRNCDILSGDDAVVIKSTSIAHPSTDITAKECKLSTRTNAIKIGTESIGGFQRIHVSDCRIVDTQMAGVAIYAVDGGDLRDVTVTNLHMEDVTVPISIRLGKRLKTFRAGEAARESAGRLRDVTIRNISAKYVQMIGVLINGVPDHPVENLTLENIHLECFGGGTPLEASVKLPEREADYPELDTFGKIMPAYGLYARHVRGLRLSGFTTKLEKLDARPEMVLLDVEQQDAAISQVELAAIK